MRGGRAGVGVALLCALLVGCTPDPAVGPSPGPSPSVSAATPTETAAERQERLDYEAAEKAYRTFRAEYGRVLRAGGARKPTKVMKETAGGEYLKTFTEVVRGYEVAGSREEGKERIIYVRQMGYSAGRISLDVCEDSRRTRTVRENGDKVPGELRTATLEVRQVSGAWRVWSGDGQLVESCE